MLIVSKFLVPKNFIAITICPFIFFKYEKYKNDLEIRNHEKIHLRQQLELLLIFFYIIYLLSYIYELYKGNNYKKIIFEREAFANESNFDYLKKRKFWNWIYY